MVTHLRSRSGSIGQHGFVGRQSLLTRFEAELASAREPARVLYLHGRRGMGKSALLAEFARVSREQGRAVVTFDAGQPSSTPGALRVAYDLMRSSVLGSPREATPHTLLIDNVERIADLEWWLRTLFLPSLPSNVLAVLASRQPLSASWRSDPSWSGQLRVELLPALSASESERFLALRNVSRGERAAWCQLARGVPLALSLIPVCGRASSPPTEANFANCAPHVLAALAHDATADTPSPRHRRILEVLALGPRQLTPEQLTIVAGGELDHALGGWLSASDLVHHDRDGLGLESLARAAISSELMQRDPEAACGLWQRHCSYLRRRLAAAADRKQRWTWALQASEVLMRNPSSLTLLRREPELRVALEPLVDPACGLPRELTGTGAGDPHPVAEAGRARPTSTIAVVRDGAGGMRGFISAVPLDVTRQSGADPLWARSMAHWQGTSRGACSCAGALYLRVGLAALTSSEVNAVLEEVLTAVVAILLSTAGVVRSYLALPAPSEEPPFLSAASERIDHALNVDGESRPHRVYVHCWPGATPWELCERMLSGQAAMATPPVSKLPTRELFERAVRDALRHFHDDTRLAESLLARSAIVAAVVPGGLLRAKFVQDLLRRTSWELTRDGKLARGYAALEAVYFTEGATQHQAAERLGLTFSTFRRHLKLGICAVVERLWLAVRERAAEAA